MKLGFEESAQAPYDSGSQTARILTEAWATKQAFCPNCGHAELSQFPNNRPVADLHCKNCNEEFELKSQKSKFGSKVVDGAYHKMCERLAAENNPNLMLLNYIPKLGVNNFFVVPKHFFVVEIIEKRKPLRDGARRAGWIGCNILLSNLPEAGKIHIVRDGVVLDRHNVLEQWQKSLFLREETATSRGWLLNVLRCVEAIHAKDFSLDDVYAFESRLSGLYPMNQHVRQKIRQQLQVLRDRGYLVFLGRGRYRLL
ncbi:DpnI domain-containing protein [Methylocapsa sp. S129]|uniref:DpnI domain-containing protein n=1 Tax=Methylocapsa sp. S129 TaxID=1641869 RepID=UPI00131B2267|nr:DpnI domain-containing protein [Methylocapsa sp. S129]